MTTEQDARARAQAKANETGRPWAVGCAYGGHGPGAHKWGPGCPDEPACERIDPAPAKGAAPTLAEQLGPGYAADGWNEDASAPPAPLARDMTLRQYLAAHAPEFPYSAVGLSRDNKLRMLSDWAWAYADAVLAAENKEKA